MWELKKVNVDAYNNWKETHICSINHVGSAGAMEVVGMKRMFARYVRLHCLRYTFFIEDGDTKSFEEICKSDIYIYSYHHQRRMYRTCPKVCWNTSS